jgi:hypothetical protein
MLMNIYELWTLHFFISMHRMFLLDLCFQNIFLHMLTNIYGSTIKFVLICNNIQIVLK